MLRIIVAGVLGALAMFVFTTIVHMATPLGATGISQIADEASLLEAMKAKLGDRAGLYLYPNSNLGADASTEEKAAALASYNERLATRPSGILVYAPPGARMDMAKVFGVELAQDFVCALAAAWLASLAPLGFFGRWAFVAGVGVPAVATTNVSYWNWYAFPADYTLVYMAIDWASFVVAGLLIAIVFSINRRKT